MIYSTVRTHMRRKKRFIQWGTIQSGLTRKYLPFSPTRRSSDLRPVSIAKHYAHHKTRDSTYPPIYPQPKKENITGTDNTNQCSHSPMIFIAIIFGNIHHTHHYAHQKIRGSTYPPIYPQSKKENITETHNANQFTHSTMICIAIYFGYIHHTHHYAHHKICGSTYPPIYQ